VATTLHIKNEEVGDAAESRIYVSGGNNGGGTFTYYNPTYSIGGRPHYADRAVLTADSLSLGLNLTASASGGDMRFFTNGDQSNDEKMRILANGNVGIGTTSPGNPLHVQKNWGYEGSPMVYFENTNDGDVLYVKSNALSTQSDKYIADFQNNTGSVMAIKGDGKVGIGTTVPVTKLHVINQGGYNSAIFETDTFQNYVYVQHKNNGGNGDSAIIMCDDANGNCDDNRAIIGRLSNTHDYGAQTLIDNWVDGILKTRITLAENGNVGIGNVNPQASLDVNGNIQSFILNNVDSRRGLIIRDPNGFASIYSSGRHYNGLGFYTNSDQTTEKMVISGNGYVGIGIASPSQKLDVAGNVRATSFINASDESLKKEIQTISGLEIVKKLRGVAFKWKDSDRDDIGLIAQEVEKVLPEIVHTDASTGLKSVEYANIIAPLIEALKEQQTQIEYLKNKIEKIENKISSL